MSKGKGKSTVSTGPKLRKSHGPKRHLHSWTGAMKWQFGKMGMLSKYNDYDSFCLACNARGKRNPTRRDFQEFVLLPRAKQKEYFASLAK